MNLIEDYLKKNELNVDLAASTFGSTSSPSTSTSSLSFDSSSNFAVLDKWSQEKKLEYFYRLFMDLDRKYYGKCEDIKRLQLEQKKEISELESYVHKVKELTEEREKLSIDFKEENDELKNKIRALEREIEFLNTELDKHESSKYQSHRRKSDSSDDDLSESTIEMLILEGFGKIVSAPNHEKIATILADRSRILEENNKLKKQRHESSSNAAENDNDQKMEQKSIIDQVEMLQDEIEIFRSTNDKLCRQIDELKSSLDEANKENEQLKERLMNQPDEYEDLVESYRLEIAKLKDDNINLKMEVEKLYDEIGTFELETKQLRDDNKKLNKQLDALNTELVECKTSAAESKFLKKEIDTLNNELDELIQFKANYEHLKVDYDKLSQTLKEHEKIVNEKLASPKKTLATSSPAAAELVEVRNVTEPQKNVGKSPQLELQWIRGENEKLYLDLEKIQTKLNDKINQYNELKQQLASKDDEMKEFIKRFEKDQTSENDLINLQKKVLELESHLDSEKEQRLKELDAHELAQNDLLKRNDQLWMQLNKFEKNYNDAVSLINELKSQIQSLEEKVNDYETRNARMEEQLNDESEIRKNLNESIRQLKMHLSESNDGANQLAAQLEQLAAEKADQYLKNETEREHLNEKLNSLTDKNANLDRLVANLRAEIESLNKEKTFIINQNEMTQQKVLNDYLSLQEKLTDMNYQIGKLSAENFEYANVDKENRELIKKHELTANHLELKLKQEIIEKNDALEKIKYSESLIEKNTDKINELTDTLHRVEIQKSKLEMKVKELEILETKHSQLQNDFEEKRQTLTQSLEKCARLESQVESVEKQLADKNQLIVNLEKTMNELNGSKHDAQTRLEENLKLRHDYESEKSCKEKAEVKLEELRDDYKKQKTRLAKLQADNGELKNEIVELKSQLDSLKSKLNLISDKSHTEFEKNSALQDELNEVKKKLELTEIKCTSYSQKFDLLMKKYENRKIKQKNKVERLWDYLQRERVKYKDLLASAQNDLNATKNLIERENELKSQHEFSYQQVMEEKSKLMASVADRDAKLREMKRQNFQLQSKIKFLEEEIENLNEKIDNTSKERNKLRKELNANMTGGMGSLDLLDCITTIPITTASSSSTTTATTTTTSTSANNPINQQPVDRVNITRAVSTDPFDKSFKSSSYNLSYWNELNTSSNWDVNYNTGNIHKYAIKDPSVPISQSATNNSNPNLAATHRTNVVIYDGSSLTADLNSIINSSRSYR